MEANNTNDIISRAVVEAVAPLYEKINALQEAINKPQQAEQPKSKEVDEQYNWDKAVERLRESGKIKW